jgi:hypothetical protein
LNFNKLLFKPKAINKMIFKILDEYTSVYRQAPAIPGPKLKCFAKAFLNALSSLFLWMFGWLVVLIFALRIWNIGMLVLWESW